jgi:hypothetical protein
VNISKFDVGILFSMTLAVILISFTGPVFGLTDANATDHQDIPNLSIGQNTFDVAGEFPEQPGAPSQGELVFTEIESGGFGINQLFVSGSAQGDNDGIELVVLNDGTSADPEAQVLVNDWNSGNVVSTTRFNLTSEGDTRYTITAPRRSGLTSRQRHSPTTRATVTPRWAFSTTLCKHRVILVS